VLKTKKFFKMNKTILICGFWVLSIIVSGQSLSPVVLAASGEYDENAAASLSWTLGEVATETYTAGDNILTQGFQQPITITLSGIDLNLLAYLQGPFNGSEMNTNLNDLSLLPLSQPYSLPPWNYPGTESVAVIPDPNVVDWVLVELRDATSAATATAATAIARQAAFLMSDGNIRSLDGISSQQFNNLTIQHSLFAVIYHRNHLAVMSAYPLTGSGGVYSYDFTTPVGQAFGTDAQKNLTGAVYGMYSGDSDANGEILLQDIENVWALQSGRRGYLMGDMDMNSQVNNPDKNGQWFGNINEFSQIPE